MRRQEPWGLLIQDLQQVLETPDQEPWLEETPCALAGDVSVSAEGRERILRFVKHIHSVSGHGSIPTLLQALSKRRVPKHVLEVAATFKCNICEERKRTCYPHDYSQKVAYCADG